MATVNLNDRSSFFWVHPVAQLLLNAIIGNVYSIQEIVLIRFEYIWKGGRKMMKAGTIVVLLASVALSGCACLTQEDLDKQLAPLSDRIGALETKVGNNEAKIADLDSKVGALPADVAAAKADAADAKAMAKECCGKADDAAMRAEAAAKRAEAAASKSKKVFELEQKK